MRYYKDISWVDTDGNRPGKWVRVDVEKLPNAITKLKEVGCVDIVATIQTFYSPEHRDGEDSECDFYIDFDGDNSYEDVKLFLGGLKELGIVDDSIMLYFSGRRGFHIEVPRQVFGAQPDKDMHKHWRSLAKKIADDAGVTDYDYTVYKKRTLWRVPNTKHGKSGLYKIPLALDDLDLPFEDIKELAAKEQPVEFVGNNKRVEKAAGLYDKIKVLLDAVPKGEVQEVYFKEHPPCIEKIMTEGVFELHTVNAVMYRLAGFFKVQNISEDGAVGLMRQWAENIRTEVCMDLRSDGGVDLENIHRQIDYVVRTVYTNDNYGFSCAGILSIPGIGEVCTEECKKEIETKSEVTLFNALDAEYLGRRLYIKAEAVGRHEKVMAIPEKVIAYCDPTNKPACANCPLFPEGHREFTVKASQYGLLEFLEASNMHETARIGTLFRLPNRHACPLWKYRTTFQNCEMITISPRISNEFDDAEKHVRHTAYYFGRGLEPNKGYEFTGYLHRRHRTHELVLVLDDAIPVEDTLSAFKITPEMAKAAEVFCPSGGVTLEKKHCDIIASINYNHVRLWGRDVLIQAADLVFHSVRRFNFQGEEIPGWLDVLFVGDSGQGKSRVAEKLMEHYNLGTRVTGESGSRTGLLWTIPTKENVPSYIIWGVLPRCSGRLVFVDEIRPLIKTGDFAELTDVRSSGIINVTKTVFGKAKAETRVIWMTNAVGRKTMKSYGFPILAITDLIPDREDIRRFTFAIGVSSGQINSNEINKPIQDIKSVKDIYSSEVCHNHLLWVWNLQPDDVIYTEPVERLTMKLAEDICQDYVAMPPLVEPGDFRLKLARISVAAAARMNIQSGGKLIVTEDAVCYAYDFLNKIYSDDGLKYLQYSREFGESSLGEDSLAKLKREMEMRFSTVYKACLKWMYLNPYVKPMEYASIAKEDTSEIKGFFTWMAGLKFIESSARGSYRKTDLGVKFIEAILPEMGKADVKKASEVKGDEF